MLFFEEVKNKIGGNLNITENLVSIISQTAILIHLVWCNFVFKWCKHLAIFK